jgi:hypothetical protein
VTIKLKTQKTASRPLPCLSKGGRKKGKEKGQERKRERERIARTRDRVTQRTLKP